MGFQLDDMITVRRNNKATGALTGEAYGAPQGFLSIHYINIGIA
jgi:hypothetical protein